MKTLEEIFKQNTGRRIARHDHVLKVYAEFFERYRNTPVRFLEIGITEGGSLLMWKEYFGPQAQIFGLDMQSSANLVEGGQIKLFCGDQGDPEFMAEVAHTIKSIDIVVDDGSHEGPDQFVSLNALFPIMEDNGIYAIEDLHCCYRENYKGGYLDPRSIIEYTKQFPDWFHYIDIPEEQRPMMPDWHKFIYGLHYFRNMLLIEKHSRAYQTSSALLTGEGTKKDSNHEIKGSRFDVHRRGN